MNSVSWAIKNGELDDVRACVTNANVNDSLDGGRQALHFAADYGQVDVAEYLISVGADVNATDQHGITPLLAAIWENHPKVVRLLIQKGARVDGKAPDGNSYVQCAESDEVRQMLGALNSH